MIDEFEKDAKKEYRQLFFVANGSAFIIFLITSYRDIPPVQLIIISFAFVVAYMLSYILMDWLNRDVNKYRIVIKYLELLRLKRNLTVDE